MDLITCDAIDLNDEAQCSVMMALLEVYSTDIMGGGERLKENVKQNLPSELRKRSFAKVFVAKVDDVPAGLAITFEAFSTFACKPLINIHDLCVTPTMRRKGVATAMLFAVEQYAKSIGCCKITLEVLEGNHAAKKAYTGFGFQSYELDPETGVALFWEKKV
ncbi:N-acetyltransferase GCN5 [Ochromonadaceae sp. CCMP2298]|nr:N-acetyltransferase GCN5 [Ochromonadaceae sp. CCMP2298]KAJ1442382.1 N-acetyltransferase GCN5 [Ochromonadaceae sp. CCMP2298]|mmetsp:Transcript_9788/g.21770  ORF Transcript_9788/g.21770 Transcript_9788/m.21770 type:complete len:162 (-) Transcript_9788:274-759(-)